MTSPDLRPDLLIAKPCHENWGAMTPSEKGRHCAVCEKTVVDVTKMKPVEGRRFLGKLRDDLAAGAHVCVRAHADRAGRLLAPSATRRLLTNGLAAVLAVAIAGCQGSGPAVGQQGQQTSPTTSQQPVGQQAPQTMGEPTVRQPIECIQGDVAVAPQPEPQPMMGAPVAQPLAQPLAQPEPVPLMGKPAPVPQVVKGEVEAQPAPIPERIETLGKVAAPPAISQ